MQENVEPKNHMHAFGESIEAMKEEMKLQGKAKRKWKEQTRQRMDTTKVNRRR